MSLVQLILAAADADVTSTHRGAKVSLHDWCGGEGCKLCIVQGRQIFKSASQQTRGTVAKQTPVTGAHAQTVDLRN
ncbi:hypothetical protein J6590_055966 [Homalodisca vitripennis]|nr:hypothetical protein J6590_055966 [Homalodisca vitripennis]